MASHALCWLTDLPGLPRCARLLLAKLAAGRQPRLIKQFLPLVELRELDRSVEKRVPARTRTVPIHLPPARVPCSLPEQKPGPCWARWNVWCEQPALYRYQLRP